MSMLFGSALSFGSFVLVVVVAQVSTLLIFSVLLHVWALGLGIMFWGLGLGRGVVGWERVPTPFCTRNVT